MLRHALSRVAPVAATCGVLVLSGVSAANASPQSSWLPGHTYGVDSPIQSTRGRFVVGVSPDNGALLEIDTWTTPHTHCASWGSGGNYVIFDGTNLRLKTFSGQTKATILGTHGPAAYIDDSGTFWVGGKRIHGCS